MNSNQKVMVIATTDNMIWQFLLPHIKHLQDAGHTVECVCAKTGFWFDELQSKYGLIVHEINFNRNPISIKNFKGYKKLIKLQKHKQYDLIYCQQPVGGLMGRLIARKFKLPCIYTAHGFHFYKGCSFASKIIYKSIEKFLARFTTVLVTMNEEDYNASLDWKAKKKYKINGIGIDLSKYTPNVNLDKNAFKKELDLGENDFLVTSIGELNKNKNTFRLLEVIKSIDNPKIKYIICGQGPLKREYEEYITAHKLEDRVKMLGFRTDIQSILSVSDIYIMPSYREGLSRSMMEAMCQGLPVVASNIRGNIDLIGNNEGGILCSVDNNEEYKKAIISLFENENLRKEIAKRNKKFIKNYDLQVVLKQLEDAYKGL